MNTKGVIVPLFFLALASLSCIMPVRTYSDAQRSDIDYGIEVGKTQGAATVLAGLTATALAPPQRTAEATCRSGYGGCVISTYSSAFDQALRGTPTPSPVPTPSGPPLFWVVTRGSGNWTPNNLYNQAGIPSQLGFGTSTTIRVAQLTHGVRLPVYDTHLVNSYYLVMVTAWIELRDLTNQGQVELDGIQCVWHDTDHTQSQDECHAHIYDNPSSSQSSLIGIVEKGTSVRILEVDTIARMAKVSLLPLWIEASLTRSE